MTIEEKLSSSMEDYLEAISFIIDEKQAVRAKDISKRLGVNNSSVTGALHALADKDMINYVPYDVITLTSKGEKIAKDVIQRHIALRDFFVNILLIDESEAEEAACKMEHGVSKNVLDRLTKYI